MADEITIETGARLHFGLLAVNPRQGRRFGGVGVMVDAPGFRLRFRRTDADHVVGATEPVQARVTHFLKLIRLQLAVRQPEFGRLPACEVQIEQQIPAHGGLGSGTQLGLATALGVCSLADLSRLPATTMAQCVDRGRRSSIGVHGFDRGGFLVEAGKLDAAEFSPLIARLQVPLDWKWVLVTREHREGLSGEAELQAFGILPAMPEMLTDSLCRIVLMEWLPAMSVADFPAASAAMWEYGQRVGSYFACVQGGIFADPRMEQLAGELRAAGFPGVAQTSWGPTIAVLCADTDQAQAVCRHVQDSHHGGHCQTRIVGTRHEGATVTG